MFPSCILAGLSWLEVAVRTRIQAMMVSSFIKVAGMDLTIQQRHTLVCALSGFFYVKEYANRTHRPMNDITPDELIEEFAKDIDDHLKGKRTI